MVLSEMRVWYRLCWGYDNCRGVAGVGYDDVCISAAERVVGSRKKMLGYCKTEEMLGLSACRSAVTQEVATCIATADRVVGAGEKMLGYRETEELLALSASRSATIRELKTHPSSKAFSSSDV